MPTDRRSRAPKPPRCVICAIPDGIGKLARVFVAGTATRPSDRFCSTHDRQVKDAEVELSRVRYGEANAAVEVEEDGE